MSNTTQRKSRAQSRAILVTAILAVATVSAVLMPNLYGCARIGTSSTDLQAPGVPAVAKFAAEQLGAGTPDSSGGSQESPGDAQASPGSSGQDSGQSGQEVPSGQEAPSNDEAQGDAGGTSEPTPEDDTVQVTESEQQTDESAPTSSAPKVLKKTIVVGEKPAEGEPDKRRTYSVKLTYDANAVIPDGTELVVQEMTPADVHKRVLREQLELGEDDRVVAETYLNITLHWMGFSIQPSAPVDVVVETKNISPASSDAIEVVVLGEPDAGVTVENLTGKREDGEEDEKPTTTKLKLTTSKVGEFGFATTVSPFDTWTYDGQKVTLLGSRTSSTVANSMLYEDETINDMSLLRSVMFQTDPVHAWHPTLWIESQFEEAYDAANGAVICVRWEDGHTTNEVFGKTGTKRPVAITSDGEYVFLLEPADETDEQGQDEQSQEGQDQEGTTGSKEGSTQEVEATDEQDGKGGQQGGATSQDAKGGQGSKQTAGGQKLADGATDAESGTQETPAQTTKDEGEATVSADDQDAQPTEPVVRESTYLASDGRTYKVKAEVEGSAGIPQSANLVVSEVVKSDAEYAAYLSQSTKALDVKLNEVRFAKVLDISFVDPISGKEYQPNKDVHVTIELLGGELSNAQGLGVVHFGDKVESVDAVVQGDAVSFATDGFSVYVVMGYTVDFHQGEYTYSIAGESSITLSKLFKELKITDIALYDISDVAFSDPTLVKVEKTDNDWLLTSLKPFVTEETLSIVLKSGVTRVIRVTDAQAVTVSFTAEGVDASKLPSPVTLDQDVPIEDKLPTSLPEDAKPGYRFDGWLTEDNQPVTAQTTFATDTTLHASFVEQVTVTFYDEDETTVLFTRKVDKGGSLGADNLPAGTNKETCQFEAWYQETDKVTANTTFAQDTTVVAHYTVTVTFKVDGATHGEPKIIDKGAQIGELPTVTQEGYRFDGWHVEGKKDPITAETTFDANATATGSLIKRVTLRFFVEGVENEDWKLVLDAGKTIQEQGKQLPTYTSDTCTFVAWYAGETLVGKESSFEDDVNLNAKLTVDVLFKQSKDDTQPQKIVIDKGSEIGEALLEDPILANHRFDGWYIADDAGNPGTQKVEKTTRFNAHTTVVAKFVRRYTINFTVIEIVDGQQTDVIRKTATVDEGERVYPPANPERAGFRFDGWLFTQGKEDERDTITMGTDGIVADADKTLRATFVEQVTVSFVVEGQSVLTHPYDKGSSVDLPAVPELPDKRFDGWFEGDKRITDKEGHVVDETGTPIKDEHDQYVTSIVANANRTLTTRYVDQITVVFKVDGEIYSHDGKQYKFAYDKTDAGSAIGAEDFPVDPDKDGQVFVGWYAESDEEHTTPITAATVFKQSAVVNALFASAHTLAFINGDVTTVKKIAVGQPLGAGTVPAIADTAHFMGWYNEENQLVSLDESTVVDKDMTLTAKYGWNVVFNARKGDDANADVQVDKRFVEKGNNPLGPAPSDPFWENHSFAGWFKTNDDGTVTTDSYDPSEIATKDTVVTATFNELAIYTVRVEYFYKDGATETVFDQDDRMVDLNDEETQWPLTITAPTHHLVGNEPYYPTTQNIVLSKDDVRNQSDANTHTLVKRVEFSKDATEYHILYMLKNLSGNGYTEVERKTEHGLIGSTITPTVKDIDHAEFERLESGEDAYKLTSNGQEMKVYYTRKRYLLSYDLKGGSSTEISAQSAPWQTEVNLTTSVPTRVGYDFDGWYLDEACTQRAGSKVVLNDNTTVYAGWKGKQVNYTIIYMVETYSDTPAGTTNGVKYYGFEFGKSTTATAQAGSTVTYTQAPELSTLDAEKAQGREKVTQAEIDSNPERYPDSSVTINADGTSVLTVYYKLIRYKMVFNSNGGTVTIGGNSYSGSNYYTIDNVVVGENIASRWPTNVTKRNTNFYGWDYTNHSDGTTTRVTKVLELTWELVEKADAQTHEATYSARYETDTELQQVNYWLQQPDGSYSNENDYTQTLFLNGPGLGAKDIEGYTYNSEMSNTSIQFEKDNNGDYIYHNNQYCRIASIEGPGNYYYNWNYYNYRIKASDSQYIYTIYYNKMPQRYRGYNIIYNFYYNRVKYSIKYFNYDTTNPWHVINDVYYEADLSGYNYSPQNRPQGKTLNPPAPPDGDSTFTWGGWYKDPSLKTPYDFENDAKMPGSDLNLYAKWIAPQFEVNFYKNENSNDNTKFKSYTVDKYKTVSDPGNPTRAHYSFIGWFTQREGGDQYYPGVTGVTENMNLYAHWQEHLVSYTVKYINRQTNESVLSEKITAPIYHAGDTVTEHAESIAGMSPENTQLTKKLEHDSDNVITFYYVPKPLKKQYSVKYVVQGTDTSVAPVKQNQMQNVEVDGSFTQVTEYAADVEVDQYKDYTPIHNTITKALGTVAADNVITFEYAPPKRTAFTVQYLDMNGDPIPGKQSTSVTRLVGEEYVVSTEVNSYTLHHVEDNSTGTGSMAAADWNATHTVGESYPANVQIKLYYQKNLTVTGVSKTKTYDGSPLTMSGVADVTVSGSDSAPELQSVQFHMGSDPASDSAQRKDAGVSLVMPVNAVLSGEDSDYYNILYKPGMLTVTKADATIVVEPDRVLGEVYNGKTLEVGFTDSNKGKADYVIINNEAYQNEHLDQIWDGMISKLKQADTNFKDYGTLSDDTTGLSLISKKDANNYTISANTINNAVQLPNDPNYNATLYVRESILEIEPCPITITTEGAEKSYDGTPLTKDAFTLKLAGQDQPVQPDANGFYTLIEGDESEGVAEEKVTIQTTGSQIDRGESQNTYRINWGEFKSENYDITENLGILKVNARKITVTAEEVYKPVGRSDPPYSVKVSYKKVTTGENGEPVEEDVEIPASRLTLNRWDGDNYTINFHDPEEGFTDVLSLKITREAGEKVGPYEIRPSDGSVEQDNYDVTYVNGRLVIAIARVSNDEGVHWTYHTWLVNPNGEGIDQGAFNRANGLSNKVIVETLVESHERYTLYPNASTPGFTFNGSGLTDLEICTTDEPTWNPTTPGGAEFKSVIERGANGLSMILVNSSKLNFTMRNIVLDGNSQNYTSTAPASDEQRNGGTLRVMACKAMLLQDAVIRNSNSSKGNGAGVYVYRSAQEAKVNNVVFENCICTGSGQGHSGGGAYFDGKAEANCVTATNCHANGDKGGGLYFLNRKSKLGVKYPDAYDNDKEKFGASTFTNCSATAGGGVYFFNDDAGGAGIPTVEGTSALPITFTNCEAKSGRGNGYGGGLAFEKAGSVKYAKFETCKAILGGGIHCKTDNLTAANCTVTGSQATDKGGGIYQGGSNLYLDGCRIQSNVAGTGGGVYAVNNITLKNNTVVQSNRLSGNTATNAAGIYIEKGTLTLGDGTQTEASRVVNNTTQNGTNSNVRLIESKSGNATVNASNSVHIASALDRNCKINVVNAAQAFTQFGDIASGLNTDTITYESSSFAKIFEADDGVLFGCVDPDATNKVYWFGIVCKITDANRHTLTYDANRKDAIFPSLKKAFEIFESNRINGDPVHIEMLVETYALSSGGVITAESFGPGKKDVTLTTAENEPSDNKYQYMGGDDSRPATIEKAANNNEMMFVVSSGCKLTITDLVLDGNGIAVKNTEGIEAGLIRVDGALELGEGATLRNGKATNQKNRAGAVYVGNQNNIEGDGVFTMTGNSVIQDCEGKSSGAVYVAWNGVFTMDDNAKIQGCKATKNSAGGSGGAVTVGRNGIGGTFTQTGNSVIQNCTAGEMGGAVYVEDGTYNLSGSAAIKGCTAKTGAAIYLNAQNNNKDRATLKLSGSPQFGDGSEGDPANTVSVSNYASQKNGGEEVYADDKARQDIYLAGYENKNASPIQVTGKLTSGPGTIWVWAEKNPHHKKLEQFAQFVDGGTNLGDADKSTSMTAFRNARHDEETGCTGAYLTGQAGTGELIIWSGGFDFTFLKTTGYGDRLNNATFELYQANASRSDIPANATAYQTAESRQLATTNPAAVKVVVNNAVQEKGVAGDGLVTFEKVPTGTWFIKETIFPKVDSTNTDQNAARYFDQYKDANKTNIQNEYRYVVMRRVTVNANGTIKMEYAETDKEGRAVLDAQNNLKWKDVPTTKLSVVNGVQDETVPVYTFMNVSPFQRKVILRKVGEDNGKYVTPSGAKFRIYGADWREIVDQEYESDAKTGAYFVDTLPYGVYYLVETQFPTGYQPTGHDAYDATKPETWPYYKLTVGDAGQTIKNAKNEDVTIDARGTYIEGLFWGVDATVPEDTSSDTPQEPQGQEFNPTTGNPEDYSAMWGKIYLTSGTHRGEAFSFGTHSGRVTFEYGNTTYTGMKAYEWYLLSELNDDELNQVREAVDTNDLQNQGWRIDKATTIWYEGNDQYAKGFYVTLHDWNHGSLNNLNELFNSEHVVYLGNGYDVYDYNTLPLRYTAPGIPPQQGTKALIYTAEKDGKRHFWLRTNTEGGYTVHSDSQMNSDRSLDANGIPNNSQKWLDITEWVS